jgi:hypothetical protein
MKNLRGIIRRVLNETKLRTYMKDWDDNILHMPTKIKMDKKEDGIWIPVEVSTRDFAELRSDPDYRPRNNSTSDAFRDFKESEPFLRDVKIALKNRSYAPSFDDFKETLIYADPFAINTARGHKPQILRQGVRIVIDTFSKQEKEEMLNNIRESFKKEKRFPKSMSDKLDSMSPNQLIDLYLDEKGEYYSVSSDEFGKRMGLDVSGASANPEHAKKVAIADFVRKIWSEMNYWINSGYSSISFGFSDDDKKNVKAAIEFLKDELSNQYPEIHFVVYDTSEGGKNKIVISKSKPELDKPSRKKY